MGNITNNLTASTNEPDRRGKRRTCYAHHQLSTGAITLASFEGVRYVTLTREEALRLMDDLYQLLLPSTWRPIETAPKDGSRILIFDRRIHDVEWRGAREPDRQVGWRDESDDLFVYPTHWTPLPDLPAMQVKAEGVHD